MSKRKNFELSSSTNSPKRDHLTLDQSEARTNFILQFFGKQRTKKDYY